MSRSTTETASEEELRRGELARLVGKKKQ